MTTDTLIMLSGVFVLMLPFLGFPSSWDRVFLVIVGLFVIALGITVRRAYVKRSDSSSDETTLQ